MTRGELCVDDPRDENGAKMNKHSKTHNGGWMVKAKALE